jgi:hypothetical protein
MTDKKLCRVRPELKELHLCACSTNGDFDADADEDYEYRWVGDDKFEILISNMWVEFESIDFEFGITK